MPSFKIRLKKRHELFLTHYLDCFDAGLAAERAGYGQWYAESLLPRIGRGILRRQDVADALEERLMASLRGHGLSRGKVLKEICDTAFNHFDVRNLYYDDGRPRDLQELDNVTASFIEGIEVEEIYEGSGAERHLVGYVKKYKIRGRKLSHDAQVKLGEHLQLFGRDSDEATGRKKDRLHEVVEALRDNQVDGDKS